MLVNDDSTVPRDGIALELAGRAYMALGQPQRAVDVLKDLLVVNPDAVGARLLLAQAHAAAGDGEAAVRLVEEELERNPDNIEAQVVMARAHALQGRDRPGPATRSRRCLRTPPISRTY
ncbi:MAG: tetratricopeptide repeat protein [Halofilum sp. (in: g-proteobacteria)]|nr:tetratricopeptide repeat protein [Halofilum sp. (in: g-proteobacteria)]